MIAESCRYEMSAWFWGFGWENVEQRRQPQSWGGCYKRFGVFPTLIPTLSRAYSELIPSLFRALFLRPNEYRPGPYSELIQCLFRAYSEFISKLFQAPAVRNMSDSILLTVLPESSSRGWENSNKIDQALSTTKTTIKYGIQGAQ